MEKAKKWTQERIQEQVVTWRRHLHMYPELSFEEVETPRYIEEQLMNIGITDIRTSVGGRGIVVKIKGETTGPTIAFRADFDALPITEEVDHSYASKRDGKMHACGHDGHSAALLGLAAELNEMKDELAGTVVLIFQHAEEKPPGGAREMIADDCLHQVDFIFGAHVSSQLPLGKISCTPGPIMAAVDAFKIKIQGKGGHGAQPHTTVDSIVIGSQLIGELQTIVSRRIDPMETAVVTVGAFQAGTAFNVIADSAHIEGTVRTFNESVREQIENEIKRMVQGKETGSLITSEIDYLNGYPALVNWEEESALVRKLGANVFGNSGVLTAPPSLGGEDFSFYLKERKGAFFHVGARTDDPATHYPHHHPKFNFEEKALEKIRMMFMELVKHYLIK